MPRADRITAARRINDAAIARGTRQFQQVVRDALTVYAAVVRARILDGPLAVLTADAAEQAPDLNQVDQGERWIEILDQDIMPGLAGVLGPITDAAAADPATATAISAWRDDYMARRRQELVRVPDSITRQLRDRLAAQTAEHGPDPQVARQTVLDMLDDGSPEWRTRASVIARTEVVGANNQGGLASWQAMAAAGGMAVDKTWLATEDGRTRPSHAALHMRTVPLDGRFDVGAEGVQMTGPHDPAAPADEVVQCRCTLVFTVADDEDETPAPEVPGSVLPTDLATLNDDDLAGMLAAAAGSDNPADLDRVMAELDARDAADARRAAARERAAARRATADAQREADYDARLAAGDDPEAAYADVYGVSVQQQRAQGALQQLRDAGYSGAGFREITAAAFRDEARRLYLVAEDETNGYLLNRAGRAAGVDPASLFTGPESRARKYASDELLTFWQANGRYTVEDYRAGLLGGAMRSAGTADWI